MSWIEHMDGARAWHGIFKDYDLPADLRMLYGHFTGNAIQFRLEAPLCAREYPKRWRDEYNCFGFDLGFVQVSTLAVDGFNFSGLTELHVGVGDEINVTVLTSGCTLRFVAKAAYIANISGYYNEMLATCP